MTLDHTHSQDGFSSSIEFFGRIVFQAIEDDNIESIMAIPQHNAVTIKSLSSFYPGIVTYCVKRTIKHGVDDQTTALWSLWVPETLSSEDEKYSLIALKKLHEITRQKMWLSDLSLKLMNAMSDDLGPHLIPFIVFSFPTIERLSDCQLAQYSDLVRAAVIDNLTRLESRMITSEPKTWDSHSKLMDIGSRIAKHEVAARSDNLESVMTTCSGLDWPCFVEIIKRLDWSREDSCGGFPDLMIRAIRGYHEEILASIADDSLVSQNCRRFIMLYCLGICNVTPKKFFRFSPFMMLEYDVEILETVRQFVWFKYQGILSPKMCLVQKFKECIFDAILMGIRRGTICDAEIGNVVSVLMRVGLDHSVLIDLIRDLESRYEPRSCRIWVLEIFLAVSAELPTHRLMIENSESEFVDESTLLLPTELVAIELIDYLKFFIDISDDMTTDDPILSANNCFIKSAFALRTIRNCLQVFLNKYPQIIIVKLCDFWDILSVYFPPNLEGNENKVRALFTLEILGLTAENKSVAEFFADRINQLVSPVLQNNCSLDDPMGIKIIALAKILVPDKFR